MSSIPANARATDSPMTAEERKVIFASSLGTVFEWYDFYLYGSLAAIIAKQFFSGLDPSAAFIFALLAFAAIVVALVYLRRSQGDPNPFQSAFLSWFGTLRGFWNRQAGDQVKLKLPSGYLVENPPAYRIGGRDMQAISRSIQAGDILLRGYDGYVHGQSSYFVWLNRSHNRCARPDGMMTS